MTCNLWHPMSFKHSVVNPKSHEYNNTLTHKQWHHIHVSQQWETWIWHVYLCRLYSRLHIHVRDGFLANILKITIFFHCSTLKVSSKINKFYSKTKWYLQCIYRALTFCFLWFGLSCPPQYVYMYSKAICMQML